jgi:hypothetical protein
MFLQQNFHNDISFISAVADDMETSLCVFDKYIIKLLMKGTEKQMCNVITYCYIESLVYLIKIMLLQVHGRRFSPSQTSTTGSSDGESSSCGNILNTSFSISVGDSSNLI